MLGILIVVAAARVLFFAVAFPLFNDVDEVAHIDLVLKYDMGLPTGLDEPYATATRNLALRYGTGLGFDGGVLRLYWSPGYMDPPLPTGGMPLPFWMAPAGVQRSFEAEANAVWSTRRNHEAGEPPLYYVIAAQWAKLGRVLGFADARLLYWIRGMDVLIVALLVVLAAAFGRVCDPTSAALAVGLPLLIAAFPQKAFYSITNDALSPLVGGLAVYYGLRVLTADAARSRDALLAGLMIGLAIMTKLSNLFLVVLIPWIVAVHVRRKGIAPAGRSAVWLLGAMAVPLAVWRIASGPLGFRTGDKAAALGWGYRPLAELSEHPILTVRGAWAFLSQLLVTFWRGEVSWHGVPLALSGMDALYGTASLLLLGAAAIRLFREPRPTPRRAVLACLAVFGAGVFMLAGFSMAFTFGDSGYPSRTSPFFWSGRLIGAALLPFAAVFVYGLEAVLARTTLRGHESLVVLNLAVLATVTELMLSFEAIGSLYNGFHLP